MWSRRILGAAALAAILSCPASAQIEDSGLEQVDPWGMAFLSEGEPSFRTRMWRGAQGKDLLALTQAARTSGLTPGEHMLMRRLALSGARAPSVAERDTLLAERARIAFELGEAAAAAQQMAQLTEGPPGIDPAVMAADLNLTLGNEATACDTLREPGLEGDYWAKLRAVCAALSGNTSGAELAMEIAQAQGVNDSWLANAIFATSGVVADPPEARFDSGLAFAMSTRANLNVGADAVPEDRPDIAAAMARRKLMPPAVRVKAANLAAEAGLITSEEYRIAYNSALAADGFTPASALDRAVFISSDPLATTEEKSRAIAAALEEAAGKPARYSAVSGLMLINFARLPLGPETEADALVFARAALAAGDLAEAARWITPAEPEEVPAETPAEAPEDPLAEPAEELPAETPPDAAGDVAEPADETPAGESEEPDTPVADATGDLPASTAEDVIEEAPPEPEPPSFDVAWMGALIVLADAEAGTDEINMAARTLMDAARTEQDLHNAARMFALWTAAGTPPPSDARAHLAAGGASDTGPAAPGPALAVLAAARSGTAAEVVLSALALTDGDPSELDLASLTLILGALQDVGAADAARQLALEATGFWKTGK